MVTVVVGGMSGSCGKGKMSGHLALTGKYSTAACSFSPNAGHTFVNDERRRYVVRQLPISVVNKDMDLIIGPAACINMFALSLDLLRNKDLIVGTKRKIIIHPHAAVVTTDMISWERDSIRTGSTFTGSGAARAFRAVRKAPTFEESLKSLDGNEMLPDWAKDYVFCEDTVEVLNNKLKAQENILVEGSQGFELDTYNSTSYPYVTSKMTTVDGVTAELGISHKYIEKSIMVVRPYPIRISNVARNALKGEVYIYSGNYGKAKELKWSDIEKAAGAPIGVTFDEYGTVTGGMRRVFDRDFDLINRAIQVNKPDEIFLNFAQQIDYAMFEKNTDDVTDKMRSFISDFEEQIGYKIKYLGTGARNCDLIVL